MMSGLITTGDIAKLAKVKPGTVRQWALRHESFPTPTTLGLRLKVYQRDEVLAWLREHRPELLDEDQAVSG